jgi:hypothetical protein
VGWKLAEAELQHWAIGTGNVYLLLLLQLLENKVIINLTCSEFVEGQEVIKLSDWFLYFLISFSLQEINSLVKRPFISHKSSKPYGLLPTPYLYGLTQQQQVPSQKFQLVTCKP